MNASELLEKYAAGERSFARAYLAGADLARAYLAGADLAGAYLAGADLTRAYLAGADLTRAYLAGAYLAGADLTRAYLADAYLADADLTGADLTGADLTGADLAGALGPVKADMWMKMCYAAHEVPVLLEKLRAGDVDGSIYQRGGKGCFVGTLACARGVKYDQIPGLEPNSSSPVEKFFLGIRDGHTPENNQLAAIAAHWIEEFLHTWQPETYPAPGVLVLPDVPREVNLEPVVEAPDTEDIPF